MLCKGRGPGSNCSRLLGRAALLGFTTIASFEVRAQSADGTASGLTGSPSNATGTVSPVSVAQAVTRSAARDNFGLSLGTSIQSGKFGGTSRSEILSTALGVRYSTDALRLTASMPYMRIHSAATIISGIDSTPVLISSSSPGVKTVHDGLGDLTLGASYTFPAAQAGLEVEVSGRVKLPTATKASGLSSQRVDYSGGIQLTRQFGRLAPFGSVTYRIFTDPHGYSLRDGLAASVGSSLVLGENIVALASYHYARAASRLIDDAHELFAGASYLVPRSRLRLTGFATAGLSSGAAAVSGGISAAVNFP